MMSVEQGHDNTFTCETMTEAKRLPRYNILSYTWGRWRSDNARPIDIKGTPWKIPAVQQEHFTPEVFERVLRIASKSADYVWVDVACINQGRSPEDVTESMDQVGKQMGIFSQAYQAFVWLNRSSKEDLQKAVDGVILSGLDLQDELYDLKKAKHVDSEKEKSVCDLLERIGHANRSLCSDPWFSSLWTLQESVLRRDAIILSREGLNLAADEEGRMLSLAIVGNAYRNLRRDLNRYLENLPAMTKSPVKDAAIALREEIKSNVLAFMVCSNPNVPYGLARHRTSKRRNDRIYGIMQVYGFRLGKAVEPHKDFTLEDLEVQFSTRLNESQPVLAQSFVHLRTPEAGRSWQITPQSEVPASLISYSIRPKEDHDSIISINSDLHASIRGNGWCLADMIDILVNHCGNVMLDHNNHIGMENIWASIRSNDRISLFSTDPEIREIVGNLYRVLRDSDGEDLSKGDLMLVYLGKVQRGSSNSWPVYLGVILLRQRHEGQRYDWVRVGISTWYVEFDKLPPWQLFEGICG